MVAECYMAVYEAGFHDMETITSKIEDMLEEKGFELLLVDPYEGRIIVDVADVKQPAKKLRDTVWKHNNGMMCAVTPMSYDEADEYL